MKGIFMKDGLIRRSDVQNQCHFIQDEHGEWILAADIIKLPAVDAVEVVRCRECLFRGNRWTGCPKLHGLETPDDFFCKYGKPKRRER